MQVSADDHAHQKNVKAGHPRRAIEVQITEGLQAGDRDRRLRRLRLAGQQPRSKRKRRQNDK